MKKEHSDDELVKLVPGFSNGYATVNGVELHYVKGGAGTPLLLVPGWPETWWAYHSVMPLLAVHYEVIVVDVRGMGSSSKPADGYDKKNMARDVYELVKVLGYNQLAIGGHDIGAHVAFSVAANYPEVVSKLIMLDTPHPDDSMYRLPMLPIPGVDYVYPWWVAFNQVKQLPEQLLEGRMVIVIDWIFDQLLTDKNVVTAFDRAVYAAAYNSAEAIRASNAWYQAFGQDIMGSRTYAKLSMPVLGIGGSGYALLQHALPAVADTYSLEKIDGAGHFILAEKPKETARLILEFLA
jgi:pimeloyl-ACP methyl ester carboxylesterase